MTKYDVYFQNPTTKERTFQEQVSATNILEAQTIVVQRYLHNPEWNMLKSQLVVVRAGKGV